MSERAPPDLPPTAPSGRRGRRGRALMLGAAALVLTIGGALAWLIGSQSGLKTTVALADGPLGRAIGAELGAEGLSGSLWRGPAAERLSVAFDDGTRLEARDLVIRWSPGALIDGLARIERLAASRVSVDIPPPDPDRADRARGLPAAPPLPVLIEALDVPEISVALAGQRFDGRAAGRAAARADGALEADLDLGLARDGRPADRLRLRARLSPGPVPTLSLEAEADLPGDGLAWALAGVDGPWRRDATARLTGTGPLTAWRGELDFAFDRLGRLAGPLDLRLGDEPALAFDGRGALEDAGALGLAPVHAGPVTLALEARREAAGAIALTRLRAARPGLVEATGEGRFDPRDGTVSGLFDAAIAAPALAPVLPAGVQAGPAWVTVHLAGTTAAPLIDAQLDLAALSGVGLAARDLNATVSIGDPAPFDLTLRLFADRVDWPDPALARLLGPGLDLRASGRVDPARAVASEVTVDLPAAGTRIGGDLAWGPAGLTAPGLTIALDDLAPLGALAGVDMAGRARVALEGARLAPDGSAGAAFDLQGAEIALAEPALARLVGSAPTARGRIDLSAAGAWALALDDARLAGLTASGSAALDGALARLDGALDAEFDPAALPLPDGLATGPIRLTARLQGPPARPAADLRVDAALRGAPVEARARVSPGADTLAVEAFSIAGPGMTLDGSIELPGFAPPARGAVDWRVTDAASLSDWLGGPAVQGRAAGRLILSTGPAGQAASLSGEGDGLALGAARLAGLSLSGRADDAIGLTGIDLEAVATGLAAGPVTFTRLDARARGAVGRADIALSGAGRLGDAALTLDGEAETRAGADRAEIAARRFDAALDGQTIALEDPARIVLEAGRVAGAEARLTLLGGVAALRYARGAEGAEATLDLVGIDPGPLAARAGVAGASGRLDANLALSEPAGGAATGRVEARLDAIALADADLPEGLTLSLDGRLASGRLGLDIAADGPGLARAQGRLDMPLALSLARLEAGAAGDGALSGALDLDIALAEIWAYLPAPEHAPAGRLEADIALAGTLDSPRLTGTGRLRDGSYDHLEFGTALDALDADILFDGERIVLRRLAGRDPAGGTLAVDGAVAPADPLDGRAAATMRGLTLVATDALTASADADLTLDGRDGAPRLAGTARLLRGEVNLTAALPPSVPSLEVERPGGPDGGETATSGGPDIALDLTVEVPGQLFVRGRGLESEWAGTLRVSGTTAAPAVEGELVARRGQFTVIGKRFTVEESRIRFPGGAALAPILDIRGVYRVDDLTVTARLTGPADNPSLALTSTPALPRDEILSRVLFGKTRGRLSALEAAQLAAAAAELSGTGPGLDLLGRIRRFVGVDVLEFDGEAGRVRAGTYVADEVFVGVNQGAAPGTGSVEVEVDVAPNVTVGTETGPGRSNVGVRFKWDY